MSARTADSFDIESSLSSMLMFWSCAVFGFICYAIFGGGVGFAVILLLCFGLAHKRARNRRKIREVLDIRGDFSDDCIKHICCPCCAICQEAREAKGRQLENVMVDYCTGERLSINDYQSEPLEAAHYNLYISITSRIIVVLYGIAALLSCYLFIMVGDALNIIVLLLIFVQPFTILYFVFWRRCRHHASVDIVLKLFAVGFWFTTFQSIILEEIIQFCIALLIGPFLTTTVDQSRDDTAKNFQSGSMFWTIFSGAFAGSASSHHRWLLEELDEGSGDGSDASRKSAQQHIGTVIFTLFLMVSLLFIMYST